MRKGARGQDRMRPAPLICVLFLGLGGVSTTSAAPLEDEDLAEALFASRIVQRAGIERGVCSVLGAHGDLPIALARASELLMPTTFSTSSSSSVTKPAR